MTIERTKLQKRLRFLFLKLPLFLGLFALVMIVSLKLVERHPNPLRQGFEQYLSQVSGRQATISELQDVEFFPNFIVKAHKVTFHNPRNAAEFDISIEDYFVSTPVKNMFGFGASINDIQISNVDIAKDVIAPFALHIDDISIVTESESKNPGSFLVATGAIDGKKSLLKIRLQPGHYHYSLSKEVDLHFERDGIVLDTVVDRKLKEVSLKNTVIFFGDQAKEFPETKILKNNVLDKENPALCLFFAPSATDCKKYLKEDSAL